MAKIYAVLKNDFSGKISYMPGSGDFSNLNWTKIGETDGVPPKNSEGFNVYYGQLNLFLTKDHSLDSRIRYESFYGTKVSNSSIVQITTTIEVFCEYQEIALAKNMFISDTKIVSEDDKYAF